MNSKLFIHLRILRNMYLNQHLLWSWVSFCFCELFHQHEGKDKSAVFCYYVQYILKCLVSPVPNTAMHFLRSGLKELQYESKWACLPWHNCWFLFFFSISVLLPHHIALMKPPSEVLDGTSLIYHCASNSTGCLHCCLLSIFAAVCMYREKKKMPIPLLCWIWTTCVCVRVCFACTSAFFLSCSFQDA